MATVAAELLSLQVLGRSAPRPFPIYRAAGGYGHGICSVLSFLLCSYKEPGTESGLFHTTGNFSFPRITHLSLSSLCTATVTGFRAMTT